MSKIVKSSRLHNNQYIPIALATVLSSLCFISKPGLASEPNEVLLDVLRKEAAGVEVNRAEKLLAENPSDSDKYQHWYSGEIFVGGNWTKIDQLSEESLSPVLLEYKKLRGSGALNIVAHQNLAKWCAQNGLTEQSIAHWFGVLDLDEENIVARNMLGFVKIGTRWFSSQDLVKASNLSEQRLKNLKTWMPKIQQYAIHICGSDTKKKSKALSELRSLQDEQAIDALYGVAIQLQGDYARPFIAAIKRFKSKEACHALVKFAIACPSSAVAEDAIAGIKEYRHEFYVPELLSLIEDDVEFRQDLVRRPNGDLVLEQAMYREGMDNKSMQVINRVLSIDRTQMPQNALVTSVTRSSQGFDEATFFVRPPQSALLDNVALKNAEMVKAKTKETIETQNSKIREFRDRVLYVLKQSTEESPGDTAHAWWLWFDRENDYNRMATKKYNFENFDSYDSLVYDRGQVQFSSSNLYQPTRQRRENRHECLVAGTMIQTNTGLTKIEDINIGDLVLTSNVDSGEIEMKPVLKTMVRPPCPTLIIKTESHSIQATLGHYWWVAGQGWLRTRELENGMLLHTAKGTSTIQSIEPIKEPVKVFNLIVGDNHTYFVGEERILSNDGTEIRPTLLKVPGLSPVTGNLVAAQSSKQK